VVSKAEDLLSLGDCTPPSSTLESASYASAGLKGILLETSRDSKYDSLVSR